MIPRSSRLTRGTKLELLLILISLGFTCAAVGASTNPATGLAVNAVGGVSFGNLYYSTWGSFGCAFTLLLSYIRTERGVDLGNELKSKGSRFRSWVILIVTTLIVMGSSASSYDAQCDVDVEEKPGKYCRRAALGVTVGCIGCVTSLTIVAMRMVFATPHEDENVNRGSEGRGSNTIIFAVEGVSSAVLFCAYGFAVAYLTSEKGPGAPLGNLYYSSWATFGLTFFVAASCFEEFQAAKSMILTGRQQQKSRARDSLASNLDSNSLDPGRMGAVPTDWTSQQNTAREVWSENSGQQDTASSSNFGKQASSSVGEVQIS